MLSELNRLHVFYQIFKSGGVSSAAEKLHISQPAVSQHLKKLEEELRVTLFTRLHRRLVPTAAGIELYATVDEFFNQLPEKLKSLRYPADQPFGIVRIGAPYEFGKEYLPEICHNYRKRYPGVRFAIRLGEPIPTLGLLYDGEVDFAIIDYVLAKSYLGTRAELYSITPLIDEELTLICSAEYYAERIKRDHSFKSLKSQDFISDEHDATFLHHWFYHHFSMSDLDLNIVMTVESHQASINCVKLGMGLTVTSSHMVWEDIENGTIIALDTGAGNAINTISLIQLQDKVPTLTEKSFSTFLSNAMLDGDILSKFRVTSPPSN